MPRRRAACDRFPAWAANLLEPGGRTAQAVARAFSTPPAFPPGFLTPSELSRARLAAFLAPLELPAAGAQELVALADQSRAAAHPLARLADRASGFDRCLAAAVAAHPAIDPNQVRAILFPPGADDLFFVLWEVRDLHAYDALTRRYQEDLEIAVTLQDETEAARLRVRLSAVAKKRAALASSAAAAKIDGPHRWGDIDWTAPLADLAAGAPRFRPERLPLIGDRITALAVYLATLLARRRRRANGPRLYTSVALALTAELSTAACACWFPFYRPRPFTVADVKNRVLKRRAGR